MNRIIKFRGRSVENGQWKYFDLHGLAIDEEKRVGFQFLRTDTITQFTGLLDKNGKEIYEGDLFGKMGGDAERPGEYEIHAKVYFDEDLGAFCIDDQRGGWEYLFDYLQKSRNEREVIGNIYENPELLNTHIEKKQ